MPRPSPEEKKPAVDASYKAQQDKERREQAVSYIISVRTLAAITAAVPVRLLKRDLLFVAERLTALLNENHLIALARQHGIKSTKDGDSVPKLFNAYLRRAEESKLGSIVIELTIVLAAARGNSNTILREAAAVYKVNPDAIALKVKQEFAAKEKAKKEPKPVAKVAVKPKKAA